MSRTTLYDIYKAYKHGEDFVQYGIDKVYRALKREGEYQVFIVETDDNTRKLYNYIPEDDKFYLVMEESQ